MSDFTIAQPKVGRFEVVNGEPRWIVPIDVLVPDPANTNTHDNRSVNSKRGSLKRFKQIKPVAIRPDFVITAGNGIYLGALAEGWTELWVTNSGLEGVEATAYGIADNQTAKTSKPDENAIDRYLREMQNQGSPLDGMGFDDDELAARLRDEEPPDSDPDGGSGKPKAETNSQMEASKLGGFKYSIVIECTGEDQQRELLQRFEKENLTCRALIS